MTRLIAISLALIGAVQRVYAAAASSRLAFYVVNITDKPAQITILVNLTDLQ